MIYIKPYTDSYLPYGLDAKMLDLKLDDIVCDSDSIHINANFSESGNVCLVPLTITLPEQILSFDYSKFPKFRIVKLRFSWDSTPELTQEEACQAIAECTLSQLSKAVGKGKVNDIAFYPTTSTTVSDAIRKTEDSQLGDISDQVFFQKANPGSVVFDVHVDIDLKASMSSSRYPLMMKGTVGTQSRQYVIKSPEDFLWRVDSHTVFIYGKGFSWNHNIADLDEKSRIRYELYRSCFTKQQRKANDFPLSSEELVKYIAVACRHGFPVNIDGVAISDIAFQKPVIRGRITKGGCNSIKVAMSAPGGMIPLGIGPRFVLFRSRDCLRAACGDLKWIAALHIPSFFAKGGLSVAETDIRKFVQFLLPELEKHVKFTGKENIPEDLIPEYGDYYFTLKPCGTSIYFLKLEAVVKYGDSEYNLFVNTGLGERNGADEMRVISELELFCGAYLGFNGSLSCDPDQTDDFMNMMTALPAKLSEFGEVSLSDDFRKLFSVCSTASKILTDIEEGGLLDLTFEISDEFIEQIPAILRAFHENSRYYLIPGGGVLDLKNDSLGSILNLMQSLGLDPKAIGNKSIQIPSYRAMFMDSEISALGNIQVSRSDAFRSLVGAVKTFSENSCAVPSGLNATLREYQKAGYSWMHCLYSHDLCGILADDMGLGKTLETLTMLSLFKQEKGKLRALVVAPASLILNWRDEAARFVPNLKIQPMMGGSRLDLEADVIVTSYGLVSRNALDYSCITFDFIILDEAQNIKNGATAAARSVKTIPSVHRFALTGTPVQNSLTDLWSLFDFLMPGFLYTQSEFKSRFMSKKKDCNALLQKMVSPFVLRRMKSEVLTELPSKTVSVRKAEMESDQFDLYKANLVASKKEFRRLLAEKGLKQSRIEVLALLMKLRQICCDPSLAYGDYKGSSAKRAMCLDLVREAISGGHSVLLFSQFTSMLDIIQKDLEEEGISLVRLDGSTSKIERRLRVESFQNDETSVFLLSLKAGGLGLNLTKADIVILYDPWWNSAAEEQAMDRSYRMGQEKPVEVYRLIASSSVEEKILELQEKKIGLSSVLGDGSDSLGDMTEEEWLSLFD
ncbi:MAG: SNF2-related protein [Sphaerochaetaceae bacterium]